MARNGIVMVSSSSLGTEYLFSKIVIRHHAGAVPCAEVREVNEERHRPVLVFHEQAGSSSALALGKEDHVVNSILVATEFLHQSKNRQLILGERPPRSSCWRCKGSADQLDQADQSDDGSEHKTHETNANQDVIRRREIGKPVAPGHDPGAGHDCDCCRRQSAEGVPQTVPPREDLSGLGLASPKLEEERAAEA